MTNKEAMEEGWNAGTGHGVVGWGVFGWAFAVLALPVVYLRSPKLPAMLAIAHDDAETLSIFERAYVERLKHRQVSAVWLGAIIGVATVLFLALLSV